MQKKPPTQRQLKVAENIRHNLSDMFIKGDFYLKDGKTLPYISVSEVRISPDLKNATAYIMPLGGEAQKETLETLNQHLPQIRKFLSTHSDLRHTPNIRFEIDSVIETADKMNQLFHKIKD